LNAFHAKDVKVGCDRTVIGGFLSKIFGCISAYIVVIKKLTPFVIF